MSADHLYFSWRINDEGRPEVTHDCLDGRQTFTPPNPPWHVDADGGITPSFDCALCGRHVILRACDRTDGGA